MEDPIIKPTNPVETNTPANTASNDSGTSSEPSPTPVTQNSQHQSTNLSPKKSLLKIVVPATLILVIILGLGVWKFALKSDNKSSNKSSSVSTIVKKEIPVLRVSGIDPFSEPFFPPAYNTSNGGIEVRKQIFESLVTFRDKSNITPLLAVSWTNPDTSTWVFKLKNGVKFHNGTPLTSKQVKGSIEATMAIEDYSAFTSTIKSVDAVDDNTVKITTKTPDGALLNKLTYISIYDTTSKTQGDSSTGTGPYIIKEGTTPRTDNVILSAISNYHGGNVLTKEVQLTQESDFSVLTEKAIKGEYDTVGGLNTESQKKITDALPKSTISYEDSPGVMSLYLNTIKDSPLKNKQVRKALYQSLDIQTIIDKAAVTATAGNQTVSAVVPGYNPKIKAPKQDIAAAKKALSDAGYPNGFTFDAQIPKPNLAVGTELKKQFADIGVTMNIIDADVSTFFKDVAEGKFVSWLSSYTSDINDISDVITVQFQNTTYKNYYISDLLNKKMNQVNSTFDSSKRLGYMQEASAIVMDDVPLIPIRVRRTAYIFIKPIVANVDYSFSGVLGVNYWTVYEK